MNKNHPPYSAAAYINSKAPGFTPKIGIILGSGHQGVTEILQPVQRFSYEELPGFPPCTVRGHYGALTLGTHENVALACLQGRPHFYEGHDPHIMRNHVRTLKLLGCEILICTNAAGSLRAESPPGSLVLVYDHINFQFMHPLTGSNDENFGPRFYAMTDAYDAQLRTQFLAAARSQNLNLTQGVYLGVLGPSYETPAEIRAFRTLGADVVGMSTISEVLIARHCGMRVAAISTVTNMGSGLDEEVLTHENVLTIGSKATADLKLLLSAFIKNLSSTI